MRRTPFEQTLSWLVSLGTLATVGLTAPTMMGLTPLGLYVAVAAVTAALLMVALRR